MRKSIGIKITNPQLKQICSSIKDSKFCYDYMTSSPDNRNTINRLNTNRTSNLLNALVNRTHDRSVENCGVIQSMINQTSDKVLQERYSKCLEFFETAKTIFENATTKTSDAEKYLSLMRGAEEAMAEADKCYGQFSSPPEIPTSLDEKIQEFDRICDLVDSVSSHLNYNYNRSLE